MNPAERGAAGMWASSPAPAPASRCSVMAHHCAARPVSIPMPGPYRTRLPPGGTFATPTIFLGAFADGPDGAGNIVRRWVRAVLNNPRTLRNPSYPLMVNNSWGSGMAVNEALAHRMIERIGAAWARDVSSGCGLVSRRRRLAGGSGKVSPRHRERRRLCPPARPQVWSVGRLDAGRHVDCARARSMLTIPPSETG
jgi:hypothetical protein